MKGYRWNSLHTYSIPSLFKACEMFSIPGAYLAPILRTPNPEPRSLKFFSQKYYTSLWSNFRPHYLQTIGAVLKFSLSKNFIRLGISSRIFFLVFFEILSTHLRTTHATDQSHLKDFILSNMLNYYHILFDLKLCNKLVKFF